MFAADIFTRVKEILKEKLDFFNDGKYVPRAETAVRRYSIKTYSENFHNIHSKTSVLDSLFYKFAGLQACNFIKKRFQRRCFPVNIAKFFRTIFL